jgi:PIN domain nuclease of toxin-antitoxin system
VRPILLDTHVVLWAFSEPERLSSAVRALIVDPKQSVLVSAASVWEVEIKRALGKLAAPDGFGRVCVDRGFDELPITFEHATAAGALPPHHSDPFDRMLVAQSLAEGAVVVTADAVFARYGVHVMAAG